MLRLLDGVELETRFVDDGTTLRIGAAKDNDWVIQDVTGPVLPHHFEITKQPDGWFITDIRNPVSLGKSSAPATKQRQRLITGDKIQFGPYVISVSIEDIIASGSGAFTTADGVIIISDNEIMTSGHDEVAAPDGMDNGPVHEITGPDAEFIRPTEPWDVAGDKGKPPPKQ